MLYSFDVVEDQNFIDDNKETSLERMQKGTTSRLVCLRKDQCYVQNGY